MSSFGAKPYLATGIGIRNITIEYKWYCEFGKDTSTDMKTYCQGSVLETNLPASEQNALSERTFSWSPDSYPSYATTRQSSLLLSQQHHLQYGRSSSTSTSCVRTLHLARGKERIPMSGGRSPTGAFVRTTSLLKESFMTLMSYGCSFKVSLIMPSAYFN